VSQMEVREQRPSYVRFEKRAVEDRVASMALGHYMTKDVDFAIITPIGSKDMIPREAEGWLASLEQQAREERIPKQWVVQYKEAYAAWKRGEELPVSGTAVKGWPVLSPAQQANVIAANVRTVEDLAQANDEAMRRIGMGGVEMKQKAEAWLKAAKNLGGVTQEISALKQENITLKATLKQLEEQNQSLRQENALLVQGQKAPA
jgi:hypothetical protein